MAHIKFIKRKKPEIERSKIMYKYEHLNIFHHDHLLKVYIFAFMYVNPETMPLDDHFTATKTFVVNYKKISTL